MKVTCQIQVQYGQIGLEQIENIIFKQGYSMKKPSDIVVSLRVKDKEILEVKVGGKASSLSDIETEI